MQKEYLISIDEFCAFHNVEMSFINSLHQTGLVEITTIKEAGFVDCVQLKQLEKIIRFYFEFDINLEGIETITHLLAQIESKNKEIIALKSCLQLYE